jgi:hypothetical protein
VGAAFVEIASQNHELAFRLPPMRQRNAQLAADRAATSKWRIGASHATLVGGKSKVQSRKESGRATDSSGLRSAEAAKNHAINPAAIINAAPTK